ncbi:MAG: carboxypeptidase-like regulatory domain-containing protein, partial [Flavitalea sp.]
MYLKILCKTFSNRFKISFAGLSGSARLSGMAIKLLLGLLLVNAFQASATGNNMPAPDPIKGKVVDKTTGSPVSGATVSLKGQSGGTSSNDLGEFTINIPSGRSILVISSVGYTTTEQAVSGSSLNIVIAISQAQAGLEEVVVTALGIQRSVKSLTYSTQRISGEQVNQIRDANFANTLSGKIAGLTVTSSANGPGGASRIILRGNRSINGDNNALIVVDGVAIDNSTPSKQTRSDAGDDNGGQSG